MRRIELLSPARDLDCGIEAIRCGADAVYVGGPSFGARAVAGNSVADITALCDYAHVFGARVYVTLNTLLYDNELDDAVSLAWQLYRVGVDALIVQDWALTKLELPPIPLHASTQMDNRTPEDARRLEAAGFSQIVVARELGLEDISRISSAVSVPIEAFVHGALCVSYSGRCNASQFCFRRSANRGECAQFCRLPFDLLDADGRVLVQDKHLLSLRDMNRSDALEQMMDAGVCSFKIEGRLKDVDYVKNVTAFYRQCIDEVLKRRSDTYVRSSFGSSSIAFTPDVNKSFNRGFTHYFLFSSASEGNGAFSREEPITSFSTPKMRGEPVGKVGKHSGAGFVVTDVPKGVTFNAGDGLTYFEPNGHLCGFRLNRVENSVLVPFRNNVPPVGTPLYRNSDSHFERVLHQSVGERRLNLSLTLREVPDGFALDASDECGRSLTLTFPLAHQMARKPQRDYIAAQMSRLGETPYRPHAVQVLTECFIPASLLGEWRRNVVAGLLAQKVPPTSSLPVGNEEKTVLPSCDAVADERARGIDLPTSDNVDESRLPLWSNAVARDCLSKKGLPVERALEISSDEGRNGKQGRHLLMTCRHCLRHSFGQCPVSQKPKQPWREPLSLRLADGRTFPLSFDCSRCEMSVWG